MTQAAQCADIETSSLDYATRFSGAAGEWLLSVQSKVFLSLLKPYSDKPCTILDVGGGHGQIAQAISDAGLSDKVRVTVLGSDPSCNARITPLLLKGVCNFQTGDLVDIPFSDGTFDIVTSFRFIPHCPEWPKLIASMCRVAKKAVIVDYPTSRSINALTPFFFAWKKKLEGNTRTYDLFSHNQIEKEFKTCGYANLKRRGEFFWPMVVHRKLNCPPLSSLLEAPFALTGISNILGSPVILRASK